MWPPGLLPDVLVSHQLGRIEVHEVGGVVTNDEVRGDFREIWLCRNVLVDADFAKEVRNGSVNGGKGAPDVVLESWSGGSGIGEALALFNLRVVRFLTVLRRIEDRPEIGDAKYGVGTL